MNMKNFEVSSTLKKKPKFKKHIWKKMKNEILGEKYELSLVFIGDKKSKNLNMKFRKKKYKANILSFPLEKNFGEIFINFPNSIIECKKWGRDTENFIDFLFIHGLAHLKNHNHTNSIDAKKMEKFEKKYRKKFNI